MTIQVVHNLLFRKTVYSTQIWPKLCPLESDDLHPYWVNSQDYLLLEGAKEKMHSAFWGIFICHCLPHICFVFTLHFLCIRFLSSKSKVVC